MAIPLNTPEIPSHARRVLDELAQEQKRSADERITAWAVVWTLFAFKFATVALIWYAARGTHGTSEILVATSWYWLVIPVIALSGMVGYRWRLYQMRRRRLQLYRSEWMDYREKGPASSGEGGGSAVSLDDRPEEGNRSI